MVEAIIQSLEKTKNNRNENINTLKDIISNELNSLSARKSWVWPLFLVCVTPNILNGFHTSSYILIAPIPDKYWCVIPDLINTNWTDNQIKAISSKDKNIDNICEILNRNYSELSNMTYNEAIEHVQSIKQPMSDSSCLQLNRQFQYEQEEGISIVAEWNLICENSFWRTNVQVAVSIGKFFGASLFGILSDKFGRKKSFVFGSIFFIIGSILSTISLWYWLFLIGRVFIGFSHGALFIASFILLSENIDVKYRSWLSIAFPLGLPIGSLILSVSSYLVQKWRLLQLTLTIPSLLLFFCYYYMNESPRWLLSKGYYKKAYKIVFKTKLDKNLIPTDKPSGKQNNEIQQKLIQKLINSLIETFQLLYGNGKLRKMLLISHFIYFATSLAYVITALNADNLAAHKIVYIAITAIVDIFACILSMLLLRYFGRIYSASGLLIVSGITLLGLQFILKDLTSVIVTLAMLSRLGITAVFAIINLHTAEIFSTDIRNTALGANAMWAHIGAIIAPYIVDFLGKILWFIPTTICGICIVIAGILMMLQPETKERMLEDHIKD